MDALRSYERLMDGDVRYQLRHRIQMHDLGAEQGPAKRRIDREDDAMKLSPDGRYLFVVWSKKDEDDSIRIYDIHGHGKCVMVFEPLHRVLCFDVDITETGALRLAIIHSLYDQLRMCVHIRSSTLPSAIC